MELQKFINENENYLDKFKELRLKFNKYSNLGLIIIKTDRKKKYDYEKYPWIKYCRGVIIDSKENRIINVPPINSLRIELNDILINDDLIYENLIEGTMINMFYHNNTWMISTRSNIGCNNKFYGKSKFSEMFNELSDRIDYEKMNKRHCYSFVLQHKNNRMVIPVYENNIILVNEVCLDTYMNVELSDINVEHIYRFTNEDIIRYKRIPDQFYMIKGITIRDNRNNIRYKCLNVNYEYVKELNFNNPNSLIRYVELRKNNKIKEYLKYFPEDKYKFNQYRQFYYNLVSLLYKRYELHFIKKEIKLNDIEYSLKPLLFELHNHYLESDNRITVDIIRRYINNMESRRILFIMRHL